MPKTLRTLLEMFLVDAHVDFSASASVILWDDFAWEQLRRAYGLHREWMHFVPDPDESGRAVLIASNTCTYQALAANAQQLARYQELPEPPSIGSAIRHKLWSVDPVGTVGPDACRGCKMLGLARCPVHGDEDEDR